MTTNEVLKLFVPPLFSAGVAFMLFYLTTRRDRNKDKEKKDIERLSRAKYLSKLAIMSRAECSHQYSLFTLYIKRIKDFPLSSHTLEISNITSLERLFKIVSDELSFNTLTELKIYPDADRSITFFTQIVISIDYMHGILENMFNAVNDRNATRKIETNKYSEKSTNLAQDISSILIDMEHTELSKLEKMFSDESLRLQLNFSKQSSKDIGTHFQEFTLPFLSLCYKCVDKSFVRLKELIELIKSAEDLRQLHEQMLVNSEDHWTIIEKSNENLKSAIDNLNLHNKVLIERLT